MNKENENYLFFCKICDETNKRKSKLSHNNSKSHEHKKNGTVVREYEFIKPEIDEVNYLLNNTYMDCEINLLLYN